MFSMKFPLELLAVNYILILMYLIILLEYHVIITNFGLITSNVMEEKPEYLIATIMYGETTIAIIKLNAYDYLGNNTFINF